MINRLNNVIMIKFNSIHLFICSFFFIVLFSSCSHDSIDTSVSRLKDTDVVELTQTPETNFTVSNGTLSKYLKLFYKGKAIDKVEPIIKDGDILGYLVQYSNNNGWDVISSDIRLSPVLLSCPEGKIDLTKSEDKLMIQGMIEPYYAKRNEKSGNAINGTWAFLLGKTKIQSASPSGLLPSTKSQNKINGRGLGQGMWLPVDTTIRERMITSPRLTSASWGQDYPFNIYTPKENNQNCPLGCAPVAAGQLLHAYFRNSPGQHCIPSTADISNPNNTSFSHFTTTAWSQLAINEYDYNHIDSTAVFLAWIGDEAQMHATYHQNGTGVTWNHLKYFLDNYFYYQIGFNVSSSSTFDKNRFCDTVMTSIFGGSPILISSQKVGSDSSHVFIIDQCRNFIDEYVIRYVFDPYHIITENDLFNYPQWCFEWPANCDPFKDTAELEIVIERTNDVYVRFNWGWGNNVDDNYANNTYNLLRSRSHYIGESGSYNDDETIYLSWTPKPNNTFSNVEHWIFRFRRSDN